MRNVGGGDMAKAVALFRAGDAAAAARACKAILRRDGRNAAVLYLLALAAMAQGDLAAAERVFEKATALDPDGAEIWANRGNNLIAMRLFDRALAAFDRALAIDPQFAEVLYNRAKLLNDAGRLEEALADYDTCLQIMPDFADPWNNRGTVLMKLGRHDEALAAFDKCLAITPDAADTLNNRGNVLVQLGRYDEAMASYDKCVTVAPGFSEAWNNVGKFLIGRKRYAQAAGVLGKALELDPRAEYALGNLLYANQQLCRWDILPELSARLMEGVGNGEPVATPAVMLGATASARHQLQCARAYVARAYPSSVAWPGGRYAHDRIRIAYLSADFGDHPVASLLAGVFERHDLKRFETIAVSFSSGSSGGLRDLRNRIENAFGQFIDVGENNDLEVAHLLRRLEVDVAIDLMGFTRDCRPGILARRPAPVQVNYLGYSGTMGAGFIDYIIADRCVIPSAAQSCYSEAIIYLPDTYMASDNTRKIADRHPERTAAGLPVDGFVFCAFNQHFKITPEVFDIWMRLLDRIGGSVLWLSDGDAQTVGNLRREAEKRGIRASRLVFAQRVARPEDHLARHRLAGLFLDTLPYNAHATANDALWAGLPVVTCAGSTFAGRVAASLIEAVCMPELVTASLADYEALAFKLATDAAALDAVRAKLARNRDAHALFDTDRFRQNLESAYITIHERCRRGEPPAGFSVPCNPARACFDEIES
jgi:protein O-GlcNAc transferase